MRSTKSLSRSLWTYIKKDSKFYIFVLAAGIAGSILAAVFAFTLPELSCKELLLYVNDFFKNMNQSGADSWALFRTGLLLNLKNFGILFLLSVMVIGTPFILAYAVVQGFMQGFTLFFMFRLYGIRAPLFCLMGMLPHGLLWLPCYLVLFVVCLKFSMSLLREKQDLRNRLLQFLILLIGLYFVSVMATLLQSYVEPVLIRLISGLFLGKQ